MENNLDIPITIELQPSLLSSLGADEVTTLASRLNAELSALLSRLGLVATPVVTLQAIASESDLYMRVQVHNELLLLDALPAQTFTNNISLLFDYLISCILKAIEERPSCLVTPAQAAAYLNHAADTSSHTKTEIPLDMLTLALTSLLNLGVSIVDTSLVLQLFIAGRSRNYSAEDIAEIAFAQLRSTCVEVHIHPEYRTLILKDYSLNSEEQLQERLQQVEKRLFDELGILCPQLILVPSTNVRDVMIKINDQLIPLIIEWEPPTRDIFASMYDTLSKKVGQLISIDDVEYRLAQFHTTHPTLVQAAFTRFSLGDITQVLREVVRLGKSILDLRPLLDRLLAYDTILIDPSKYIIFDNRIAITPNTSSESANSWSSYLEFVQSQ